MPLARRTLALTGAFVMLALTGRPALAGDLTIFAAASLKGPLDAIAERFEAHSEDRVRISYAGSSILARQIEFGAPADIFISANSAWMDHLEDAELIADASRFDLVSNTLVLIAPAPAHPIPSRDLPKRLAGGRLAVAMVNAVPAGIYAKAALKHLGMWEALAPRLAQTDNVRTALALVARGEAPFGIVYASDAMAEPEVEIVVRFPADAHPTIVYPVAAVRGGHDASEFLDALRGEAALAEFIAHGFTELPE